MIYNGRESIDGSQRKLKNQEERGNFMRSSVWTLFSFIEKVKAMDRSSSFVLNRFGWTSKIQNCMKYTNSCHSGFTVRCTRRLFDTDHRSLSIGPQRWNIRPQSFMRIFNATLTNIFHTVGIDHLEMIKRTVLAIQNDHWREKYSCYFDRRCHHRFQLAAFLNKAIYSCKSLWKVNIRHVFKSTNSRM